MTEMIFAPASETGQILAALRAAAAGVPDGWVKSSDVREQLRVVRAQLNLGLVDSPPPPVAIRLRELADAGLVERQQVTGGAVFYRERTVGS